MMENNISVGTNTGGNIVGGNVFGNVSAAIKLSSNKDGNEYSSLKEAVAEIQRLLRQLEETNPKATEHEKVTYVNIATKPTIKQRAIAALKDGGETAIDEFVLENKYLKVVKSITKGWLQPNI